MGYLAEGLKTGTGTSPRKRNELCLEKLDVKSHLGPLMPDIELEDLKFAMLGSSPALVYCFSTILSFFAFWNGATFSVPLLEVWSLLF